ncbi:PfkB family carbohydrate kinase [Desulfosporosinus sp. SYSU MS00001]|uniref:PfkB family carbohydrate kinase n=1 Tax=Desulfosporosinus sp. SYSU MS00001 TaxID=3416284 RepID=UPI003CECD834
MNQKVIAFGELLLRLSPPGYQRLVQAEQFEAVYGGSEANVCVTLACLGADSYFVSKLPDNPLGHSANQLLRRYGVNTESMLWGGKRLGIYFAEAGFSQRASQVIYDRANSSVSELRETEIAWETLLQDKDWFHITGITPALGEGCAAAVLEGVKTARKLGLTVSCDFNYRQKLWSPQRAGEVMAPILEQVDIVSGIGPVEAETIFGIRATSSNTYQDLASQLMDRFGFKQVLNTLRKSQSANRHLLSAWLFDGSTLYTAPEYTLEIVDRIGGGDAFFGALIYGQLSNYGPQKSLDFAVAASVLKHTIPGDVNLVTLGEVESLLQGDSMLRVQR